MHDHSNSTLAERFWAKVDQSGDCWLWTAYCGPNGYGQLHAPHSKQLVLTAHRVAWELAYGPVPPGLWVLHSCDNRACVKPAHLFLGTAKDNAVDMGRKGRQWKQTHETTERYATLTEEQVREIRGRYAQGGVTYRALAHAYGVSHTAVRQAVTRQTWRHVV